MKDISKTANLDFTIKRGDTFYFNFQVQNSDGAGIDLSAFSAARMHVKENEYAESVLDLTSTGSTINIDNLAAGQIILSASTESVAAKTYYYDLELSNDNFIQTVMSGKIYVKNDYSK